MSYKSSILGLSLFIGIIGCQSVGGFTDESEPLPLSNQDGDHGLGIDFIDEGDMEAYVSASEYEPFSPEGIYVYFGSNQTHLTGRSKRTLHKIVAGMRRDPLSRIIIRAHTDSVGPRKINLELSRKRAEGIKSYLVKQGIGASRLAVDFAGEAETLHAGGNTKEDRRRSRRAEFILDYRLQRKD